MSSTDRVAEARELLSKLKQRLVAGELDEPAYDRLRQRVLDDLTPGENATLGITTASPYPVSGVSPRPGTPLPTPGPTAVGPSGGVGRGLRTAQGNLADLELVPGSVLLGQWELVRELGRGGFGAVFEAEELSLGVRHAVKILDPAMVAKEELLARFRREVSLMRKLVHPRIVRVYDYREDLSQNLALISMELVADGSVKQLVAEAKRRGEPIPLALGLKILGQILEALAEAHSQGVVHRDVTPGNVLLAGGTPEQLLADPECDPQVKLVDFGIAGLVERSELSEKSRVLGTAAYVAPEVFDPTVEVTPAADVYGAGAMGYELVTGHLPVGRFDEPIELRGEIGKKLNRFLLALLATRPDSRPAASSAARALREHADEIRLDCERRAEIVRVDRQNAQLRAREEEERAADLVRQRLAEDKRRAVEAQEECDATAAQVRQAPSPKTPVSKRAVVELSSRTWVGIVLLLVALVAGLSWAVGQLQSAAVAWANPAGLVWVRIPAGSFMMGCTQGDTDCGAAEEAPHLVVIPRAFSMAETETTVEQYEACVSAGRCSTLSAGLGPMGHPAVGVDWGQANAFCEWAGGRLPSEEEWEYAARGGREGSKYPWGNSISHEEANYGDDTCCSGRATGGDQWVRASPVKSFAANGYGLYDMSGNVWEQVSYALEVGKSPEVEESSSGAEGEWGPQRGGSWRDTPQSLRVSSRSLFGDIFGLDYRGFRCARAGIS